MAKVISQETFDDTVKENIVEFSMNPDEAREETIKQFEAQGISLVNIIKDLSIDEETGTPVITQAINNIKTHIGEKIANTERLFVDLKKLDEECQKSIAHRVLASKNGAHESIVTLFEEELSLSKGEGEAKKPDLQLVRACLKAINSLTNKQPDIFDAEALAVVLKLLEFQEEEEILILTIQWLQKACVMHEINRQNIVNVGIVKKLKPYVLGKRTDAQGLQLLRDILTLLRYLVLDDDIRVEFGCAHEHARQIASELIVPLTKLLGEWEDANVLADLFLTLATLAVRLEFCTAIEEAGGLEYTFNILRSNPNEVRLQREGLKLLRALAGNDTIKVHIVQQGAPPIIHNILQAQMANENVAAAVLVCVSTLTLRVKENSVALFETGIAETIVETMRLHPKSKIVQRNGAWAIRNMVSRSREQCEAWLSYGVEDLLNAALKDHPSIQTDVKAALRDLGCEVELKEEWTGVAEKKILKT